ASQTRIAENCRQDYRDVLRARFSVLETKNARLSAPFYRILVFWLMIIYCCSACWYCCWVGCRISPVRRPLQNVTEVNPPRGCGVASHVGKGLDWFGAPPSPMSVRLTGSIGCSRSFSPRVQRDCHSVSGSAVWQSPRPDQSRIRPACHRRSTP